jgi:hydroxyethylthiazole kinase-like uncharacterized protein yjeF
VTVPDWLDPLPGAEAMRATDRWVIEERGIASLELMERAGEGLALATEPYKDGLGPIVVVCGKGNNGGDGLVAARLLRLLGHAVDVLLIAGADELSEDARANLDRLEGEPPLPFSPPLLDGASVVIDAVLGTGFSGVPRGAAHDAIEAMGACSAPVVAVDVPSGVDASTGAAEGAAVRAVATATFVAPKPGLWIAPGKDLAGEVRVVDLRIPAGAPVDPGPVGLLSPRVLHGYPRRASASTKFVSGHVLVAGGSRGLTGAPCMAAEAAMRAGAGYVTALVPASLELIFEVRLLEAMTRGLPDEDGHLTAAGVEGAMAMTDRGGALVVGPGIGRSEGAQAFAVDLARAAPVALVLDADGLNAFAGSPERLAAREAPTVLTPHAGELGRLLGVASDAVGRERLRHARDAADRADAIVVLKGDDTLIVSPGDGPVAVSPGGVPALATAGTGDVLSGTVAAMLARGMEPFAAACAAVHVHLRAGALATEWAGGADGVVAGDVIAALPRALAPSRADGDRDPSE